MTHIYRGCELGHSGLEFSTQPLGKIIQAFGHERSLFLLLHGALRILSLDVLALLGRRVAALVVRPEAQHEVAASLGEALEAIGGALQLRQAVHISAWMYS